MLMLKKYCGLCHHLNIPPPPYVTTSHHFRVPPLTSFWNGPLPHRNHKLYWKVMSSSYHMEWKTFIKASCINNIILEKSALGVAIFTGLWVVSFQTKQKTCGIIWSVWVFNPFQEVRRRLNKYCFVRSKYSFLYVIKSNFIFKNSILKRWLCFRIFLWRIQKESSLIIS